ncbi:S-layer protein domain-containing protein [Methanolobus chelungpuianus]|uniref:S-layer protein domain-containing protein n=1 Tax=Methanolobus chelungpuianus TaxID=502115 RepID=UPI00211447E0|nr:S-layer protein domain-containing protein [Methanolobus chelungpuianus]
MTKLTTTVVVALMLMALTVMSASAATSVEIRSSVLTGPGVLDATNFAGFYYDLDDNISTETMEIAAISSRTIAAGDLTYNTSIESVDYASGNLLGSYNVMGLFAEKYIPLDNNTPDKLSKLLLDADQKYTLRTGTALQLPEGYAITAKQIDVEGNKVWIEFSKDGEFIEDEILDVSTGSTAVWTYEADDIAGEDDVAVLRVAVTNVFQGQVDSLAVVDGIWLMDYENVLEIETDDTFDKLEVVTVGADYLLMENTNSITLTRDKTVSIAQGMSFKVADDTAVRYYPFATVTIEGDGVTQPDTPTDETPVDNGNETPGNETPVDETPVDTPTNDTPVDTPEEESPGFEAIFAVAGLLAVAYLVRRN